MSRISEIVKRHVVHTLYPSKETLEAIKRLEAGKGIKVSFKEFIELHKKIYPEYSASLDRFYRNYTHFSENLIRLHGSVLSEDTELEVIMDPLYAKKIALAKRYYKLTKSEMNRYQKNYKRYFSWNGCSCKN